MPGLRSVPPKAYASSISPSGLVKNAQLVYNAQCTYLVLYLRKLLQWLQFSKMQTNIEERAVQSTTHMIAARLIIGRSRV